MISTQNLSVSRFGRKLSTVLVGLTLSLQACGSPDTTAQVRSSFREQQPTVQNTQYVRQSQAQRDFLHEIRKLTPKNGDSGLLLGFDTDQSQNREGYGQFYDFREPDFSDLPTNQTLYLTRIGEQVNIVAQLNYIASPQSRGFVYTGQVRHWESPRVNCVHFPNGECLIGFDYSRLWRTESRLEVPTVREQQKNAIRDFIDSEFRQLGAESQDVTEYEKISFIADGFYIADGFRSRITGGAAFFRASTKNIIIPLQGNTMTSALDKLYAPQEIDEVFGESILLSSEGLIDVSENATFTLERSQGQTQIVGLIETDGNAHRSFHQAFPMGRAIDKFDIYDNPALEFDAFKGVYPEILDFFVSPNQNTVVMLTDTQFIVFDVQSEQEIFTVEHHLTFNKVVMVEWATGAFVEQWQRELGGSR